MHLLEPAEVGDTSAKSRWSAEQDAMRVHAAVDGVGTDEAALRNTLGDKTPEQIKAIAGTYEQRYGAAVVAATAATVATAGSASPLMVIAISGAAGGLTAGGTYTGLNHQAGGDEIARQAAVATASGATGAVPIGRGGTIAASLADDSAQLAARGGALRAMARCARWRATAPGSVARTAWPMGCGRPLRRACSKCRCAVICPACSWRIA